MAFSCHELASFIFFKKINKNITYEHFVSLILGLFIKSYVQISLSYKYTGFFFKKELSNLMQFNTTSYTI